MVDASSGADPDGDAGPTDQDRLGISQASGETPSYQDSRDRLTFLLAEYKYIISLAAAAGLLVLASGFWKFPTLPPVVTLVAKWFAVGILPATLIAKKTVVAWFVPDNRYRVLVLDPEQGVEARDVAVPRRLWSTRRHKRGRPAITPSRGNLDAVVRTFQYHEGDEQVIVEGCNPDLANPIDVTTTDNRISKIYDVLLDKAEQLRDLRATMDSRALEIQDANLNAVMAAFEHSLSVNPEDSRDLIRDDSTDDVERPLSTEARDRDRRDDQDERSDVEQVVDEVARDSADLGETTSDLPARADGGETDE